MLFEVTPTDPIIFCALATLLAGVAVLACLAPALRANLDGLFDGNSAGRHHV
jgi:hypothetical protein